MDKKKKCYPMKNCTVFQNFTRFLPMNCVHSRNPAKSSSSKENCETERMKIDHTLCFFALFYYLANLSL